MALAAAAGVAIDNARLHPRMQDLVVLQDRERIAMDLHDTVIQQLFAVGLSLEATSRRVEDERRRSASISPSRIWTAPSSASARPSSRWGKARTGRPRVFGSGSWRWSRSWGRPCRAGRRWSSTGPSTLGCPPMPPTRWSACCGSCCRTSPVTRRRPRWRCSVAVGDDAGRAGRRRRRRAAGCRCGERKRRPGSGELGPTGRSAGRGASASSPVPSGGARAEWTVPNPS